MRRTATRRRLKKSRLIERDGLACWLCGYPMFLDVEPSHPLAVSLDRVIPGGTYADDNLKLAHRRCNSQRREKWPHTIPEGA